MVPMAHTPIAFRDTSALLRTVIIPFTEHDKDVVEANIAKAHAEEKLIDEEIVRAQQYVNELKQRRLSVIRYQELERGLLSPIRRIPQDILRYIFILAHTGPFISRDLKTFPRVATQVCSHWRTIAHSCAPLWTDLVFNPCYGTMHRTILQDCIKFSKAMPITLSFADRATPELLGDACLQALVRCAHRWKRITIMNEKLPMALFSSIPKSSILDVLEILDLKSLRGSISIAPAPKLQHLSVSCCNKDPNVHITLESVPSLVQISMRHVFRPSTAIIGLDWSQITQLHISSMEFQQNEFQTILERMPNIVSLIMHNLRGIAGSVTIPSLKEFSADNSDFFDFLTAPRLRILDVGLVTGWSHVLQFVRRSACKIDELKLSAPTIGLDESLRAPEFRSVKTLHWEVPFYFEEALVDLRDGVFPELEHLDIARLDGPRSSGDWYISDLTDILKSRLRPQQNSSGLTRGYLKTVRIAFKEFREEDATLLRDFVGSEIVKCSGVRVDISSGNLAHISTSG